MNRGNGVILALAVAAFTACASGGGSVNGEVDGDLGGAGRPSDNTHTRAAGVHLLQATQAEGEAAREHYEAALADAIASIEAEPDNARGYFLAGQSAIGAGHWVQADTMFDRALTLYPEYQDQVRSEREEGWVNAYNAGIEAVNAGEIETARDLFAAADQLYTERPEARMNLGWAHMRLGDNEGAIRAYRGALEILYGDPPEGLDEEQIAAWARDRRVATFNAAELLAESGQPAEAAALIEDYLERNPDIDEATQLQAMTAQANFLAAAGEAERAQELMDAIMNRSDLSSADYFQIGIGFFNTGDYAQAATAFAQAAQLNPYSRDALLNLVQSLYSEALELEKAEAGADRDARLRDIYEEIVEASEQVQSFDPLNRNLLSFMLRAYRGLADLSPGAQAERYRQQSQDLFREYQAQSYEVSDISLSLQSGNQASVTGLLTNLSGTPGTEVRLRFTAVASTGSEIDSELITVALPATGESAEFRTQLDLSGGEFAGWKYEVMQ